MSLGTQLER